MHHWRYREVDVPLSMVAARRMWGCAWRVDTHVCEKLGTRRATVVLCAERPDTSRCTPVGWCSMRWELPSDARVVVDHIAWDDEGGVAEEDAWRALIAMADEPVAMRPAPTGRPRRPHAERPAGSTSARAAAAG